MRLTKQCILLASIFLQVLILGCSQKEDESTTIQLNLSGVKSNQLVISRVDFFGLGLDELYTTNADSGDLRIFLELDSPTLADLEVNGIRTQLFLSPGVNFNIVFDSANNITFTGDGAGPNNYLKGTTQVLSKYTRSGGKYFFQLKENDFFSRLDSLSKAYAEYDNQIKDSLTIPEPVFNTLKRLGNAQLMALSKNYISGLEPPRSPRVDSLNLSLRKSNFERDLIDIHASGYINYLNMLMIQDVYGPFYSDKDSTWLHSRGDEFVMDADRFIQHLNYEKSLTELFRAKNIAEMLGQTGLTSSIDSIYYRFKEEFKSSKYTGTLNKYYDRWGAISKGHRAPEIIGYDRSNKMVKLSDLKGKIVYIDVWATWCGPCVAEIPASKALQKKFENNSDVVFMNVSVDAKRDSWNQKLSKDLAWKGVHIIDTTFRIYQSYLINGIPRYILVDKEGNIYNSLAQQPSSKKSQDEINELLHMHL